MSEKIFTALVWFAIVTGIATAIWARNAIASTAVAFISGALFGQWDTARIFRRLWSDEK